MKAWTDFLAGYARDAARYYRQSNRRGTPSHACQEAELAWRAVELSIARAVETGARADAILVAACKVDPDLDPDQTTPPT